MAGLLPIQTDVHMLAQFDVLEPVQNNSVRSVLRWLTQHETRGDGAVLHRRGQARRVISMLWLDRIRFCHLGQAEDDDGG